MDDHGTSKQHCKMETPDHQELVGISTSQAQEAKEVTSKSTTRQLGCGIGYHSVKLVASSSFPCYSLLMSHVSHETHQ